MIIHGDCLEELREIDSCSVDSIITDPPYGLKFMGKKWDYDVPSVEIWIECLRVLKPGGHLLAFAGTRTHHRMSVRIEDAGFEIRDMIAWVYGSGFPKSLDVSKAIDKAVGAEREVVGKSAAHYDITAPATDAARQWQGWGTALKPALEPITVARKPLVGTVAQNVLKYGTGSLNIDACRLDNGRWPANLVHDGSDSVLQLLPGFGNKPCPSVVVSPSGKRHSRSGVVCETRTNGRVPNKNFPQMYPLCRGHRVYQPRKTGCRRIMRSLNDRRHRNIYVIDPCIIVFPLPCWLMSRPGR